MKHKASVISFFAFFLFAMVSISIAGTPVPSRSDAVSYSEDEARYLAKFFCIRASKQSVTLPAGGAIPLCAEADGPGILTEGFLADLFARNNSAALRDSWIVIRNARPGVDLIFHPTVNQFGELEPPRSVLVLPGNETPAKASADEFKSWLLKRWPQAGESGNSSVQYVIFWGR